MWRLLGQPVDLTGQHVSSRRAFGVCKAWRLASVGCALSLTVVLDVQVL